MSSILQHRAKHDAVPSMAEKVEQIDALCGRARILPVITIEREEDVLPLADALAEGGLDTLEITLRSEHGLQAIRTLRELRPNLCVGAGTVLDELMLAEAEAAGAEFIVTPGCTAELLRAGVYSPLPLLPGISSASEIMLGYALGYRRFKLFPAELSGGVAVLKAFAGPFTNVRFCPTGGVTPENLNQYMALANVMCVGGTWMINRDWIRQGEWARIRSATAQALELLN
jgi:2-dehydro-3-deoxyphosphogluconate aldolase/(4S)-4-hydroxy-2-oxoglutarate aldolase